MGNRLSSRNDRIAEVGRVLCTSPHPTWFRQGQLKQLDQDTVHLGLSPNRGDSLTCSSHLGYLHGKKKKRGFAH